MFSLAPDCHNLIKVKNASRAEPPLVLRFNFAEPGFRIRAARMHDDHNSGARERPLRVRALPEGLNYCEASREPRSDDPAICREFYCNWLLIPQLEPEWKPEKCKFVLHSVTYENGHQCLDISVDPDYPNNWRKPEFYEQIKVWARKAAQQATGPIYFVMVQIGRRKIIVLPDREIDLGQLSETEKFEVTRDVKGGVASFAVKVASHRAPE